MDVMDRWPVFKVTWIVGLELDLLDDQALELDRQKDQG